MSTKTFEEIINESMTIAKDKSEVYKSLLEMMKSTILRDFANACLKLDVANVYIKTSNPVLSTCVKQYNEKRTFFAVCIDCKNNQIMDAVINPENSIYDKAEEKYPFTMAPLTRSGVIEFYRTLKSRLNDYNVRFKNNTNFAQTILNEMNDEKIEAF